MADHTTSASEWYTSIFVKGCIANKSTEVQPRSGSLWSTAIILHILLVVIHLVLITLAMTGTAHNIIFRSEYQQSVSFWCAIAIQSFGTVRKSILKPSNRVVSSVCRSIPYFWSI
jgi:hypothetical protein